MPLNDNEIKRYLQFVDRGILEHYDGVIPSNEDIDKVTTIQNSKWYHLISIPITRLPDLKCCLNAMQIESITIVSDTENDDIRHILIDCTSAQAAKIFDKGFFITEQ